MLKSNKKTFFIFFIFLLSLAVSVFFGIQEAMAANQVNVTAYVVDKNGQTLPDGEYDIRFAIYLRGREEMDPYPSNTDAGSRIWQENQKITIFGGVLSVYLGAINPLPNNIDFNQNDYYLGVQIGTDSEMAPRKKLGAAFSSINSSFLQGRTIGNDAENIPVLGSNGGLDPVILDKITRVGTISQGTWEGDVIADDFIAQDLTGKTYNGLNIKTSGGNRTLTVSSNVTLNQNLSTSSTPTFAAINLTDGLPIASGGTNATSIGEAGGVAYSDGTSYAFTSAGTAGQYLVSNGSGAPTWQAIAGGGVGGLGLAGHMAYWSDANNLTYDTNGNFYWDATNNRLGIGTATPAQALDIAGSIRSTGQFISTVASGTAPMQVSSNTLVANLNADYLDGQHASAFLTGNQTITLSGDVAGSGTTSIATTIANNSVDGTDIALGSDAQGDIMYYNGTDWARLAAGISGQFLATNGAGSNPSWGVPSGAGDITAVGNVASGEAFTGTQGTELYFNDSDGDGLLTIANLSAARTYTLPNATGTIITSGNLTDITATGTIASGTWNGGVIDEAYGGTGMAAYAEGDMLYYDGGTLTRLAAGTNGQILGAVGGAGNVNPTWMDAPFVGSHNLLSLSHPDTTAASPLAGDLITAIDTGGGTIRWQRYAIGAANDILMTNGTGNGVDWNPQTSITQLGTITAGTWNGTTIGVTHGGTGLATINRGGILYANANNSLAALEGAVGDDTEYLRFHWNGGSPYVAWETASGSFTSFTLSGDSGADQTISDANTLEIVGGTNITSVASATDTITLNLDSTLSGVTWNGNTIGVGYGGTGITGTPTNGQLLIGNGTNYTLAILTDGAGIDISEGSGTITIAAALGNSVDLTSEVTGILPIARGGTNANATPTAGAISYGTGSAYAFNSAGTAGQVLLSGGAGAPTWTTGAVTLAGNFITSGANSLTLTTTGITNVTLPTTGTIATLAGSESLTNKTMGSGSTWNGNTIGTTYITNDSLLEVDLKVSNTPSDGQILKYDSVTGGFSWANETGGSGSSKWTDSTTYTYLTQTSEDLVLGSTGTSDAKFLFDVSESSITFEGATNDAYTTKFVITDPTANQTITFPNASGTVVFSGGTGSSLWTNDGSITYLTETGDDIVVGGSDLSSPLSVDVSANTVRIGDGTAAGSAILNMYASDGDTGSITYNTNDAWAFEGGNVGIGDTSPLSLFTVGSGDLFQVNSSGQIAAAAGITSSGTITFSGLATDGVVKIASGVLGSEAQLAIARGGTNTNATPTAGAISYGTGSAYAFNTAGTAGQVLLSGGAGAPTWTTGTLTLAGNFITSGASSLTLTTTGETNVTLPTGGTLATLTGPETFTNKTLGAASTWNGNTIGVGYGGTGITGTPTNGQLLIGNGTNYTLANLASSAASITITNTAGGINLESSLGTSVSLTSEVTGTLPVENGGTEATTLTDGGILLGSGTGAITPMGVLGNGSIVIGDGVTDPTTLAAFSSSTGTLYHEYGGLEANVSAYAGLLKISGGATSYIPDNSTNWDTGYSHSLDNTQAHSDYLINNGADTTSGRLTAAGFTTNIQNGLQFDPFDTGAGDTSEIRFMELAANGSNYVGFKAPDNISDVSGSVIWTLPAAEGSNDNVLTTDGSGNLSWSSVASVGGMNSFTLSGDSGADQTISDANTLEIAGGTNINSVASATDTITLNLDSTLTGTIWNGNTIGVGYGGTGITGTPTNGQLLIGNGTNYTLANLASSAASITITNTAGGINLESSLGTSVSLTSEVTGILPVANGGTGITTAGLTGVPVISSGTWSVDTNALAVTHGGTGEVSEANLEDKIEGYVFDADAETISGAWTVSDNVALRFGTNNDLQIAYDETTDDRMEITDGSNLLGAFSDAGTVGNLYLTGGISTFDNTVTAGYGEFTGICLGNGINCITEWSSVSGVTGSGTAGNAVYWTSANTLGSEPYLGTSRGGTGMDTATAEGVPIITAGTWSVSSILGAALGGTGIDGSSASNGTLLIGNGSGYSLATLTDGTGITISEGAGSITIDSTLGTSVDGTEIAITSQAQGDVLYYNGSAWVRLAAGSAGQYLQGGTTPSWDTPTGAGDVTNVGDCAGGACFDGTIDGGTYLSFYDPQGTGQLITGNLTEARVWTLPDATGTVALTSDLHSASTVTDTTSIDMSITGQQISGVVLPAGVDHNSLANLTTGDYHTQYALLAGRSGGQTLIGGTASGDDLTLQTTSDVTKGSYILSDLASGLVLSTSGTLSVITDSSANWDAGYTYRLTGVTDNVTGLDFSLGSNNATLALTSGYVIPTTTQETNWGSAYSHSTATTNVHGLTFTAEGSGGGLDADTLDGHDTAYFQVAGSYQPLHANLTSLSALSYSANSFVKMTAAGTFALDTNTYLTSYTETDPIWTAAASSYFNLSENETVTGIPAFNGGTTGASAPFTVDSTYLVTNLNADLLDGQTGSYYQTAFTNLTSIGSLANGTGYLSNNGSGTFSYSTSGLISGLTANYIPYATSATAIGDSGMYWDSGNSRLGIGTITPGAALQIGTLTPANITTPANSLMVSGDLEVGGSIFMGPMSFPADSGAIAWIDMPVSTSVAADTVESYTASLGGTSILTIYGEALGAAGGVDATRVGIGTTTPGNLLSIQQAGSATANTNIFSITNSGNAASMTDTRTSILFNQYYYSATTPALVDSGNITVGTEGNWTSTTSTQDAYMAFSTVLNGTMAEKMRIDSAGNVGIGTISPSQALELGASKWLAFEGATDDTNETVLQVIDPTADNVITFPNETGTVCTTGSVCAGYQAALSGGTNLYNTYWTGAGTLGAEQYVALTRGGTGTTLTASNGGIVYSNASTLAILAGTATANQMLMSGSSTTPAWSTATYPATTTANQILYSSAANTIGGIATGNSGILVTSAGGVPSIATDIPTAVTIGSAYIYRASGTDVPVADGGTGVSSLTAYGLIFGGTTSTGAVQSLGTGTSGQVLTSQGAGALPAWSTVSGSLFTHNTNYTYLTTTTDDFVLGSSSTTNSPLFFDVSASELDIYGTTNKIKLSYDGSNYSSLSTASNGDLTIASSNTAEAALVVGNNGALDASVQFDEVTQDYYFGVDNTDHFLKMGLGTTVGTTPYFAMDTAGKIGLGGMVAPTAMLHMTGVAGTVSLEINSNETTAGNNVLMIRSDVAGADDAIFRVQANGLAFADGAYTDTGADYAEYFKTTDTDLQPGEAVCIDPQNENAVVRCGRTGDSNIMGIVSSTPSVIGNARDGRENDPNYKVIGMIGQIIGNVSTENGEIAIGDSLTAASAAGYMRKANAGESTVGIAMENFDGTKGQIHILISRRNQSLTVEKVEEAVEKNIAEMELQDQVDNLVSQASSNLNAQIENLSTTFSLAQKNIITAGITAATDPIIAMQNKLQSQMDLIQEQNDVIAGFIASMDVASMLYDESLNLGSGLLEADGIVAGALTVKIEDEKNKTIGSNYIEPKDEDNDGKSYVIKTKAVTETATIFTSFQANPNAYSWVEKVKDPETKEYIGFKINLNSEVSSRVYFDWWIVEKDDRTEEPKIEDSIEASTEASIEASTETVPATTETGL